MTATTRTRLSREQRRDQLLDLGVRLLATRSLDELSVDLLAEQAGISRGLLYHYFGTKHAFREAVVRRAADELVAQTAPPPGGDPVGRLHASVTAYVDYVLANFAGYESLIRGASGGNEALREIYDDVRAELSDRIFRSDPHSELIADTPRNRLVVRGWSALAEEMVTAWRHAPAGVGRTELIDLVVAALPALVLAVPPPSAAAQPAPSGPGQPGPPHRDSP